jgi:large subunit ribosomal protein L6
LEVVVERGTRVRVQGIDRHAVSQAAATIRAAKIPDPYKAKGITYEGERIRRKAGKKGLS